MREVARCVVGAVVAAMAIVTLSPLLPTHALPLTISDTETPTPTPVVRAWEVNQCHSVQDACRNVLWQGVESPNLDDKACWIHQDERLIQLNTATVLCKKPLIKCNCTNQPDLCAAFFHAAGCKDEKDLAAMCTGQLAHTLTHFMHGQLKAMAEKEERDGDPKLSMLYAGIAMGNYTGHTPPEWLGQLFCSLDMSKMQEAAGKAQRAAAAAAVANNERQGKGGDTFDFGKEMGKGWKLVRRVKAGEAWHPATDHLRGTETYGTYSDALDGKESFSVAFATEDYNEFLFALGDMSKWMVVNRKEAQRMDGYLEGAIVKSSTNAKASKAMWYHRPNNPEDPWISLTDHAAAINSGDILYGENGYAGKHSAHLAAHGGANVFIRKFIPMAQEDDEDTDQEAKAQKEHTERKHDDYDELVPIPLIDRRPCVNDSVDTLRIARGEIPEPLPHPDEYKIQLHRDMELGCEPKDGQFDDDLAGVPCERRKGMERPCARKDKPCRRFTDQMPYYNSTRLPCRRHPSMAFLENRPPEHDAPDNLRAPEWNEYMEYQDKHFAPDIDEFLDPDKKYVTRWEKKMRRKAIGGEDDEEDLVRVTTVKHKPTHDIPHVVRAVDMDTPEVSTLRHNLERDEGREKNRRVERRDAELLRVQEEMAEEQRRRKLRRAYFSRLRERGEKATSRPNAPQAEEGQ